VQAVAKLSQGLPVDCGFVAEEAFVADPAIGFQIIGNDVLGMLLEVPGDHS
jgi:hypothetical protein